MSFFRETNTQSPSLSPIRGGDTTESGGDHLKNDDDANDESKEENIENFPFLTSSGKVFGTFSGVGSSTKRYFRFTNVQLTDNNTLTFFLPPGMTPPPPQIVDIIINNASTKSPSLPTTVTVRAGKLQQYQYLNINYVEAETNQPKCKKWERRPVYLLTMQHSENIWHAWADGLLGAFQTLREQGLLPLAHIDEQGNMQEYIDDLPEECPVEILIGKNASASEEGGAAGVEGATSDKNPSNSKGRCRKRRNVVSQGTCDPSTELWCRPGLIVGANATIDGGPVLLPYKGTEVVRRWHHLFEALSEEIIDWDSSFGTCFSEMYIGKSNVLQFYMPLKMGRENTNIPVLEKAKERRSNSTDAVKSFMLAAERLHRAMRHVKKPNLRRWPGYSDPAIEVLRQGIGPEDLDLVNAMRPTKERAAEFGEMTNTEWQELDALLKQSEKSVPKAVELAKKRDDQKRRRRWHRRKLQQIDKNSKSSGAGSDNGFVTEKPRPVVTYMWRSTFKRSVLNAHDIVTYILSRYNVTLHVTTFEEPSLEAMELMAQTDVLVGMHGAGWTNGLFIKRGAGTLQLLPYGWLLDGGGVIRGAAFQSMLLASDCVYTEWGNLNKEHAFMRRHDFINEPSIQYALHPQSSWPLPTDKRPGNYWVYQNTFVDIIDLAPHIDSLMERVGIFPTTS
jgi:hypothetical protein